MIVGAVVHLQGEERTLSQLPLQSNEIEVDGICQRDSSSDIHRRPPRLLIHGYRNARLIG